MQKYKKKIGEQQKKKTIEIVRGTEAHGKRFKGVLAQDPWGKKKITGVTKQGKRPRAGFYNNEKKAPWVELDKFFLRRTT